MYSPIGDIQGLPTTFTGASPFYPEDDLVIGLVNTTKVPAPWLTLVSVPQSTTLPNTGDDLYKYLVEGNHKATITTSATGN